LEPRPQNHAASRLRPQPEPPMAGRTGIWVAQADQSDPRCEAAGTAQGRVAVRLQLRRPQPHASAETDSPWTTGKPPGAVRLKAPGEPETALQDASNAA